MTITITAVAAGGTLSAILNGKTLTYTVVTGDTTTTAAAALAALLTAGTVPEYGPLTISQSAAVITFTGPADGRPFAGMTGGLTSSASGGTTTLSQATTVAGSSPSDVGLAANWNRAGSAALPQNGDDVILGNTAVPILYNLTALAAVLLNSYTRRQDFTGTVGLPENNPQGYVEYLPTYLQLGSNVAALPIVLGSGVTGTGPGRERYDLQTYKYRADALAAGSALDDYAIRLLGTNTANVVRVGATSVGVATLPGETANLDNLSSVGPGGTLALGPGVTVTALGVLTCQGGTLTSAAVFGGTFAVTGGGTLTVQAASGTQATVSAEDGSSVLWESGASITTWSLYTGAVFVKSDPRPMTITNSSMDGDTTQVQDPWNAITWSNATVLRNAVKAGPFLTGPNRSFKLS